MHTPAGLRSRNVDRNADFERHRNLPADHSLRNAEFPTLRVDPPRVPFGFRAITARESHQVDCDLGHRRATAGPVGSPAEGVLQYDDLLASGRRKVLAEAGVRDAAPRCRTAAAGTKGSTGGTTSAEQFAEGEQPQAGATRSG